MREQLRHGGFQYISFILLDMVCLVIANVIAVLIYLTVGERMFGIADYIVVVVYMLVIDVFVAVKFDTLNRVLRRKKCREFTESLKQVVISIVILALILFSTKQGAEFSRVTIYMAYILYLVLMISLHLSWRKLLKINKSKKSTPTALLITIAGYAYEGISVVENSGMTVKGMFITDKTNEGLIRDIPVIVSRKDAMAFICWEWIDKVYVCGPDSMDVPEALLNACSQMGIPIYTAPTSKGLDYEVIKIRTALQKGDANTGLSFFESEHDIPFRISRIYTIFESEQDRQRGFHAHKQSWHLLFCPYGCIDVMVDTGKERRTISLSSPFTGLILHPSVWREMVWKKPGSILCVAASGHYDTDKLRDDYTEYQKFLQEKDWSAVIESAEIMGGVML